MSAVVTVVARGCGNYSKDRTRCGAEPRFAVSKKADGTWMQYRCAAHPPGDDNWSVQVLLALGAAR